MSLMLSQRAANEKLERMSAMMRGWKEKANEQAESFVETGVVAVAGFGLGMADARWGEDAIAGMSTSLAVALAGHGLAITGLAGKTGSMLARSAGNAGVAVYSYKSGYDIGTRQREGGGTSSGT